MNDNDKILENYIEPDAPVEYLFVEKAEEQVKVINDDQGYIYGFINISYSGEFKNDNIDSFKQLLEEELNYCLKEYNSFKTDVIDFNDYKFGLIDNYKNIMEYNVMNDLFFNDLIKSLRNLLIVGKDFEWEATCGFSLCTLY